MKSKNYRYAKGFVLIEALVAFIIVSLGLLSVAKLQSLTLTSAADSKARAQAIALVEQQLDSIRNQVLQSGFTGLQTIAEADVSPQPSGSIYVYRIATSISTPDATNLPNTRLVEVTVSWGDLLADKLGNATGGTQSVSGRTLYAWDDPALGRSISTGSVGGGNTVSSGLVTPEGAAKRGNNVVQAECTTANGCTGQTTGAGGTLIRTLQDGTVQLLDSNRKLLIYLPAKNGVAGAFATITGRVYVDRAVNGFSLDLANVKVRLSSEGECIQSSPSPNQICSGTSCNNNNVLYEFFDYTCYMGEGWYGNVGVWISGNSSPKVCVGDPSFNSGRSDATLISAHPQESSIRAYRGFRVDGNSFLTTGIRDGGRYPTEGAPLPANYSSSYPGVSGTGSHTPSYASETTAGDQNHFHHDFLLTKGSGGGSVSCQSAMSRIASTSPNAFRRNAGAYYCLRPDNFPNIDDACPATWPGFLGDVGGSGGTTYSLTVTAGNGGTVTSNPAGIDCGGNASGCLASFATDQTVVLTPAPASGFSFAGWTGDCTGTGSCSLVMTQDRSVGATFNSTVINTFALSVTVTGSGSGSVSSSPTGITNCTGGTCSNNFTANSQVTLTATATNAASTFSGWSGGGCSGNSATCTVTMSAAQSVTATFQPASAVNQTLTVTKSGTGSGTVTSSPAGINCGSSCSASFSTSASITLTAAANSGSAFGGWSGACSGSSTTCTVTMSQAQNVTATFNPTTSCVTAISGARKFNNSSLVITSPSPSSTSPVSSCTTSGTGNNSNFSCSLHYAVGTSVRLTETGTGNNQTSTRTVTTDCGTQTNVNMP